MPIDPRQSSTALVFEGRSGTKWRIVELPGGVDLGEYRSACEDLARHACEPNVFYEPWMLEPALAEWATRSGVAVVLVIEEVPGSVGRACGLFPIVRRPPTRRCPMPSIALWKPIHCFLCTPLLRGEVAAEVLEAFFDWLDRRAAPARWMDFSHVALDGPFGEGLAREIERRGRHGFAAERFERAIARTADSADAFVRRALNGKRRHELARLERRLGEQGKVTYGCLPGDDPEALERWLADFLDLEASGWKGRAGTAIACRADERRFFEAVARGAYARGRLMILSLELDGRPIALKFNLLTDPSQAGGFAIKMAYDEGFAEYSPGMLLQLENVRRIHAEPRLAWMDSCAQPDHPMMDRIWRDRRTIGDILTSLDRTGADAGLRAFAALRRLKRKIGEWRSNVRTGGKRSA